MPSRRAVVAGCAGLTLAGAASFAHADTYDALYQQALSNPDLVQDARADREGQQVEYDLRTDRGYEVQVRASRRG